MPQIKALISVSRPVAACQRCRRVKTRCDGKLPACTACERSGRAAECSSTSDEFAKGRERSYVAALEAQIERLASKLAEARAKTPSSILTEADPVALPVRSRPGSSQRQGGRTASRNEACDIDALVADFGLVSVNATARDFYGFTEAMSYARLILSASTQEPLHRDTAHKVLPQKQEAMAMIERYHSYFFVLLPFFDEASFYASLNAVYDGHGRKASLWDSFIVRMVLAITYCWLTTHRGDDYYLAAVGHVSEALRNADQVIRAGSVSSIQALLLLVVYATVDPVHFDAFTLIGAAARAMVDLGMHQDPPRSSKMSKAKLDLRRRIFHCVYALDRSTSIIQRRALSFYDEATSVGLPALSHPTSSNAKPNLQLGAHALDGALDHFRIRQIQSAWYQDLFQSGREPWPEPHAYIWRACNDMHDWFTNIAPTTSRHIIAFFQWELLWSLIQLLGPSDRVRLPCEYAQNLLFEYSIQYVDRITRSVWNGEHHAGLCFHNMERLYTVGQCFTKTLMKNKDRLLSGINPPPPGLPSGSPQPPALPASNSNDRVARSIGFINQTLELLDRFDRKWGLGWRDEFQAESAALLADLQQRQRVSDIQSSRSPSAETISTQSNGISQCHRHAPDDSASASTFPQSNGVPQHQRHASTESAHPFDYSQLNGVSQSLRHASTESAPAFTYTQLNGIPQLQRHESTGSAWPFTYQFSSSSPPYQRHTSTEGAPAFTRQGSGDMHSIDESYHLHT